MQVRRFLPFLVALGLLLGAVSPGWATTVIQPTFDRLVGTSDYVVRVKVKSVESTWRDNAKKPGERYIGTAVTLDVLETITGTPPSPLVLDLVGGRVGQEELTVDGAPKFEVGQESILFVRGNGQVYFPLVGLTHGYFPISRDVRTGSAAVLHANGQPLYSEKELEPGASPAAPGPQARAMTPEAFRNRIQQKQHELLALEKQN
jgi:hypothetical protein